MPGCGKGGQGQGSHSLCPVQKVGGQIPPSDEYCSICYRGACYGVDGKVVYSQARPDQVRNAEETHHRNFTAAVRLACLKRGLRRSFNKINLVISFFLAFKFVKKTVVCVYSSFFTKLVLKSEERIQRSWLFVSVSNKVRGNVSNSCGINGG